MNQTSFSHISIVSCGTMSLELNYLRQQGFLEKAHIIYTTPGLHEDPKELESQLVKRITQAKKHRDKVIVVYGGKFCYVNKDNPTRVMDDIVREQGENVARIDATHCMDMLASSQEREAIAQEVAGGEKVWWMTPGWVKFREYVFKGWDKGLATENFPRHTGGAVVLDGIGFMDEYMAEKPEDLLEYSDWMGIPIQPYPIGLDRFKELLRQQAQKLQE